MGEALLVVVGFGAAGFLLCLSRVVEAEAARAVELHRVRREAMRLRNEYVATIAALRSGLGGGPAGAGVPEEASAEPVAVMPEAGSADSQRRAA